MATTVITDAGVKLMTNLLSNKETCTFKELQLSSHTYIDEEIKALTDTVEDVKQTVTFTGSTVTADKDAIKLTAVAENKEINETFAVNTMAIIVTGTVSGDIVYAAVNNSDAADIQPKYDGHSINRITYQFTVQVGATDNVTVTVVPEISADSVSYDDSENAVAVTGATTVQGALAAITEGVFAKFIVGLVAWLFHLTPNRSWMASYPGWKKNPFSNIVTSTVSDTQHVCIENARAYDMHPTLRTPNTPRPSTVSTFFTPDQYKDLDAIPLDSLYESQSPTFLAAASQTLTVPNRIEVNEHPIDSNNAVEIARVQELMWLGTASHTPLYLLGLPYGLTFKKSINSDSEDWDLYVILAGQDIVPEYPSIIPDTSAGMYTKEILSDCTCTLTFLIVGTHSKCMVDIGRTGDGTTSMTDTTFPSISSNLAKNIFETKIWNPMRTIVLPNAKPFLDQILKRAKMPWGVKVSYVMDNSISHAAWYSTNPTYSVGDWLNFDGNSNTFASPLLLEDIMGAMPKTLPDIPQPGEVGLSNPLQYTWPIGKSDSTNYASYKLASTRPPLQLFQTPGTPLVQSLPYAVNANKDTLPSKIKDDSIIKDGLAVRVLWLGNDNVLPPGSTGQHTIYCPPMYEIYSGDVILPGASQSHGSASSFTDHALACAKVTVKIMATDW